MIDRSHGLSLTQQAQLMGISRGSIYYQRKPPCKAQVQLMHRIDALHAAHPFAGSRMLRDLLQRQGCSAGRRHVCTLMQQMGVRALYCQPNTSARHPQHKGWLYLCAVVDWYSRKVLAWRLSNTMDVRSHLPLGNACNLQHRPRQSRWIQPVVATP